MPENCYHCGGDCPPTPLQKDEHSFCCDGCQTVYTLLKDNNLTQYYKLEKTPGQTVKNAADADKYAFLDLPAIQEQLIEFRENGLAKITLMIPPIHCSSCIWLLENLPRLEAGVQSSQVDFLKKEATILFWEAKMSLRHLVELLVRLGYEPHISLASAKKQDGNRPRISRSLYYKIGVAGFCFGNIMLLSFPEYVSADAHAIAPEYRQLFGYLNFLLALPIVFYCASGYFKSAWQGLQYKIMNIDIPISLGIFALFGQSSYEIFSGTGGGYMDSLAGLLFFLLIGKWYQEKIYTSLSFERDYQSYFPIAVSRLNAEGVESVPVQDLKIGDSIRLRNREIIPADSVLLSESARIDYSFVSGESVPVEKKRGDKIYAGGRQMGRSIELEIVKEVSQSHLTQLWNQAIYQKETDKHRHFSSVIEALSRRFTLVVLAIALVAGGYWLWAAPSQAGLVISSILIITCPCALALSMPVATGSAIRWLGRNSLYVKNAITVERMSEIDSIVFDKTGTLTHSQLSNIEWIGAPLSAAESSEIRSLVQHSTHPLSVSIYQFIDTQCIDIQNFDEEEGSGILGAVGNNQYRIGSRSWAGAPANQDHNGATEVHISINGAYRGCFRLHKTYRDGLDTLFADLRQKYDIYLLSGDNESEKEQLMPLFNNENKMRFRQSPMDKLQFVQQLAQQGKKVLMVGDGLNDAGALKAAYIGIAVVEDIHSFSPASDAILDAVQLPRLHRLLQFTRNTISTVRWSFLGSLGYNIAGLSFAVRAALTPLIAAVLMPLSSATVVVFITTAIYFQAKKMN